MFVYDFADRRGSDVKSDIIKKKLIKGSKKAPSGRAILPLVQRISEKVTIGKPLKTKGKIQIIGVGGVNSGYTAYEKLKSGANLIQLYTGMVYEGPGVVKKIKTELIDILTKEKIKNIDEIVGTGS